MTNYSTIIKQQDCINIIEEGLMSWEKVLTGYLKTVKNELLEKEILEKKNVELTKEVESLRADYLFEKENSWQLQQEIQSHLNTIKNLQDQRDSYLERISKDLTAQTKLIKANYEVENLQANIKLFERELVNQRTEYEKLKMTNQKLQRDRANNWM